jgi:nitroreductase
LLLGNMFLAAHSLGVGSCWINQLHVLNDEPGLREYMTRLGIPTENRIFGCACFGYADGPVPQASPRKEDCVVFVE